MRSLKKKNGKETKDVSRTYTKPLLHDYSKPKSMDHLREEVALLKELKERIDEEIDRMSE